MPPKPKPVQYELHILFHGQQGDSDSGVAAKLDQILTALGAIKAQESKIMATLDETLAAVTEESTVDDSIIALLEGLAAQIAAGGLSPADQAKVTAIFDQAKLNSAKVAAAVTANTPAVP